jgi:hypothetical protein
MSVVVFCGPTLRAEERAPYADFLFLPPVRQGELYAAARENPQAIGVIDGYFDGVPAVWHKEILWAIANGIAVFGASSMGALRAAELHVFGMRGVGRIFEAYRDGRLTDDDEVALVHGPAETGYLGLSVPMVNIRATLERAVSDGVVDTGAANAISAVAKAQFYQERSWASVLANAETHVEGAALKRFSAWLPGGKVDQKRDDALLLLDSMRDFMKNGRSAEPAAFSFEWTETWANAPWRTAPRASDPSGDDEAILDELRLQGEAYARVRREALLQSLSNSEIARAGLEPDRSEIGRATMAFRSPRRLMRQSDVLGWAARNGIDADEFDRLMAERAGLDKLARTRDADIRSLILDRLREEDAYSALRDRARAKAQMRAAGKTRAVAGVPPAVLVSWYFGTLLGTAIPDDLDDYARAMGLSGLDRLYELLAAEYAFAVNETNAKRSGEQRE